MIYLDNAATTLRKPEAVIEAVETPAEDQEAHPFGHPG